MAVNLISRTTTINDIVAESVTIGARRTDSEGRHRWTVTIAGADLLTGKARRDERTYRTNRDGDGLWLCRAGQEDQQIRGTAQFHTGRPAITAFVTHSLGLEKGEVSERG